MASLVPTQIGTVQAPDNSAANKVIELLGKRPTLTSAILNPYNSWFKANQSQKAAEVKDLINAGIEAGKDINQIRAEALAKGYNANNFEDADWRKTSNAAYKWLWDKADAARKENQEKREAELHPERLRGLQLTNEGKRLENSWNPRRWSAEIAARNASTRATNHSTDRAIQQEKWDDLAAKIAGEIAQMGTENTPEENAAIYLNRMAASGNAIPPEVIARLSKYNINPQGLNYYAIKTDKDIQDLEEGTVNTLGLRTQRAFNNNLLSKNNLSDSFTQHLVQNTTGATSFEQAKKLAEKYDNPAQALTNIGQLEKAKQYLKSLNTGLSDKEIEQILIANTDSTFKFFKQNNMDVDLDAAEDLVRNASAKNKVFSKVKNEFSSEIKEVTDSGKSLEQYIHDLEVNYDTLSIDKQAKQNTRGISQHRKDALVYGINNKLINLGNKLKRLYALVNNLQIAQGNWDNTYIPKPKKSAAQTLQQLRREQDKQESDADKANRALDSF